MRRNDLCNQLRQEYREDTFPPTTGGVAKATDPHYRHIWFVVPPKPPDSRPKSLPLQSVSKANWVLNQLDSVSGKEDLQRTVNYLFVRQEALSSSRIEGTWSTIDDVLSPDEGLQGQPSKSATSSIRGYAVAIEESFRHLSKKQYDIFTPETIRQLHERIVSRDPSFGGTPGRLRTAGEPGSIVWIGGRGKPDQSTYNPAPPEFVQRSLEYTLDWFRDRTLAEAGDAGLGIPLPARMAIGHAHFEAVHPFPDGNGRVGRALWPLQMALSGYSPLFLSGYVEAEKESYVQCLNHAQMKLDYGPIVEFISEAFHGSYLESEQSRDALNGMPEYWRHRTPYRKDSTADRALDLLILNPILNGKTLATQLGVSRQAANTALKDLVERKVIREKTGRKKDRLYAAEEVIAILARPFGESIDLVLKDARRKNNV